MGIYRFSLRLHTEDTLNGSLVAGARGNISFYGTFYMYI